MSALDGLRYAHPFVRQEGSSVVLFCRDRTEAAFLAQDIKKLLESVVQMTATDIGCAEWGPTFEALPSGVHWRELRLLEPHQSKYNDLKEMVK